MIKVAINGFGRIGRMVFRIAHNDPDIEFVAINDLVEPDQLAYLLRYDSAQGRFDGTVEATDRGLRVNGKDVAVYSERNPADLPWRELGVDVVVESTGLFLDPAKAQGHLDAGARKVALSAPPKGNAKTIVMGVNDAELTANDNIVSNASCTTNCFAPMVKVLDDSFGLEKGTMTTIHAYTSSQPVVDGPSSKWKQRRGRAAASNIVPTTTGAAKAVGLVLPHMNGRLDGMAMRVPVITGSITDFTGILKKEASVEQVNAAFRAAADGPLKGVLQYSDEPIVSSDIIGNPHASIFDSPSTMVRGNLVKVLSWYDNECGYSVALTKLVKKLGAL